MEYFIVMLKIGGLSMLYPLIMIFENKGKLFKSRIFEVLLIALFTWINSYFALTAAYANVFSIFDHQAFYLFIVSMIDYVILSMANDTSNIDVSPTPAALVAVICVVAEVIGIVTYASVSVGNTKNSASTVNISNFSKTKQAPMPEITRATKELPVVNSNKTVKVQTQNSLSTVPNSNVYDLDHMRVQYYRGKLVYVAPLDFDGGYFKYRHYKEVPGYFIVDATKKDATPKFVRQKLVYTPSAYFSHDVKRKMYESVVQNNLVLSDDTPQLEITDSNVPYYVTTAYRPCGGSDQLNYSQLWVVTVNALTGQSKVYKTQDKPNWLDIAVTPNIAHAELSQYAEYRYGWWNRKGLWAAYQSGVMLPVEDVGTESDGTLTPIAYKGKIYYFASLTSAKAKQTSVLAYAYIDAETGKTYIYKEQADAMTPDRAKSLAENRMKQTQWKPTMPLLYRINGEPTWAVSMVDENGAFMSYVYLKADGNGTQDTVATGNSARDALNKYRDLFRGSLATTSSSESGKKVARTGVIDRIARFDSNNVRFMFKNDKLIYNISTIKYPAAIFLEKGDKIKVFGKNSDDVVSVENLQMR
jgi:hypothetical protein